MPTLDVIYEDNHLLVVNKPAGIPTQGAAEGEDSVVVRAKDYLKQKYAKPGNVYVGVVSRLDALVTGVLVLARTSKAAARLNEQFAERSTKKIYWAVVEGSPKLPADRLVHHLWKDDRHHRMVVVDPAAISAAVRAEAQSAELTFRTLNKMVKQTVLEVDLLSGRKHQIRVQLAEYGVPVVGDAKYGARTPFFAGIALHARRLELVHPTLHTALRFTAPLPTSWRTLGLTEELAGRFEATSD